MSVVVDDADMVLKKGDVLFRATEECYSHKRALLNGEGCRRSSGRFHRIHQLTSYIANDPRICVAESLHYLHKGLVSTIKDRLEENAWKYFSSLPENLISLGIDGNPIRKNRVISIFEMNNEIKAANLSSKASRSIYKVRSAAVMHNEHLAELLRASDQMRSEGLQGVAYPSVRCIHGTSIALYWNVCENIARTRNVRIRYFLLSKSRAKLAVDNSFDLRRDGINGGVGYYEINSDDYSRYRHYLSPFLNQKGEFPFKR